MKDYKLELRNLVVYYESIKRELKTKTVYGFRCDERLKTKFEESTYLVSTLGIYTSRMPWMRWCRCYEGQKPEGCLLWIDKTRVKVEEVVYYESIRGCRGTSHTTIPGQTGPPLWTVVLTWKSKQTWIFPGGTAKKFQFFWITTQMLSLRTVKSKTHTSK